MVLGLIDFLLGGKKKTKVPRSGQVTTPLTSIGGTSVLQNTKVPDGHEIPTQNHDLQFEDAGSGNSQNTTQQGVQRPVQIGNFSSGVMGNKRPLSEVIGKIHEELKSTNERMTQIVTEMKGVQTDINSLGHRVDDIEESKKVSDEKISEFDENMSKFLSLYELINNQYNPFVEKEVKSETLPKEIIIGANGNSLEISNESNDSSNSNFKDNQKVLNPEDDLNSSLLELDTLNIEEAAGNAVPLTHLKNNTNSLVIILSWLEYLIKKVGIEETRNTLRYYTEVLRWITPEVYFDLDKYLRGMKDKKDFVGDESINVRDHIVSLYFISKLNEKALDEKLTRAVLQIIKQ